VVEPDGFFLKRAGVGAKTPTWNIWSLPWQLQAAVHKCQRIEGRGWSKMEGERQLHESAVIEQGMEYNMKRAQGVYAAAIEALVRTGGKGMHP